MKIIVASDTYPKAALNYTNIMTLLTFVTFPPLMYGRSDPDWIRDESTGLFKTLFALLILTL